MRMRWSKKQKQALFYLDCHPVACDILFGGAAGGGKTLLGCYWQINRRMLFPGTRGVIAREKRSDLYGTTMKTFFDVWNKEFKDNKMGVTINLNEQKNTIFFSNGSEILLKELFYYPRDPDMTQLGSLEITDAFIDEAGGITEKAKTILWSRIRYKLINGKKALLMACNPSRNFIKRMYVSDDNGNPVKLKESQRFISSTLYDNPDKVFVKQYEETLRDLPEYDKQRLLYGNWEMTENENPFFDMYKANREKYLQTNIEYSPENPLWISFDFNHSPCTAILAQKIEENNSIIVLACEQVNGGTEALCKHLNELYDWDDFQGGIKVCGDTSGMNKTSAGGNRNDFLIIQENLPIMTSDVLMAGKRNRNYSYSRSLVNYAFGHIEIKIDAELCGALVKDLDIAMVKNEKLYKDRDKGQGQDAGDAFRYLINAMFPFGIKDIRAFLNQ